MIVPWRCQRSALTPNAVQSGAHASHVLSFDILTLKADFAAKSRTGQMCACFVRLITTLTLTLQRACDVLVPVVGRQEKSRE